MYELGLVAIFKNESVILKEWLDHYINEGVQQFYLINNGSTDNFFEIIKNYNNILLINDSKKHSQTELYNKHFYNICKSECKWVLICDLDEFIYSRKQYNKISEYLNSLNESVGQVKIPWKIFGSNKIIKQPISVIDGFNKRELYKKNKQINCKCIIKMDNCIKFNIHEHDTIINNTISSDYDRYNNLKNFCNISEDLLKNCYLHCNHYQLQSKEWFLNVKCSRGAADQEVNVRNLDYFNSVNKNTNKIKDKELKRKVYSLNASELK